MTQTLTFHFGFTNDKGDFVTRHSATYFGDQAKIIRVKFDIPADVTVFYKEDGR